MAANEDSACKARSLGRGWELEVAVGYGWNREEISLFKGACKYSYVIDSSAHCLHERYTDCTGLPIARLCNQLTISTHNVIESTNPLEL